jgi:hypothetical protein
MVEMKIVRKMKPIFKQILFLVVPMILAGTLIISCQDEDAGGEPVIHYIRHTDPTKADSLYDGSTLGALIAIVGDNLSGASQIFFNDQEAELNSTYITNTTIIVNVPPDAPKERTDKLTLIFRNGKVLEYDFKVNISAPVLNSMDNEWAQTGETAAINGNYFFEPITIAFSDGSKVTPTSVSQLRLEFVVPANAPAGPITVTTNFGATKSIFHFHDNRNIILNYDNLTTTGAWRTGLILEDEHSLNGRYVKFKGSYNQGERNEGDGGPSPYESQFWAKTSGRPAGNFLPGDPNDYVMKFEAKVVTWDKSYLNLCFAPYGFEGSGTNQELWSNNFNARAIWGPWDVKQAPFSTDGKWMTFTIPMTEFKWAMGTSGTPTDVTYTPKAFDKNATGSISLWMLSATGASSSPFELMMDNLRIVSNK